MDKREIEKQPKMDLQPQEGQQIWIPPGYELAVETPQQENEPHLWDYIRIVWHRRWLVALVAVFCVSVAVLFVMRATPIFEATAKLRIESETPFFDFDKGSYATMTDWRTDLIDTQIQIIESRNLARQVVEQLNLFLPETGEEKDKSGSLLSGFVAYLKSLVSSPKADVEEPPTPEEIAEAELKARVDQFDGSLSASRVRESQIVEVKFLAESPKVAADAVNALCDAYKRWNYESKLNRGKYSKEWLDDKLQELKAKLEQAEEKLYEFAGGEDILPLADSTEQMTEQLNTMGQKLADAERVYSEKQFELRALTSTTGSLAGMPPSPRLEQLATDLAKVDMKLSEALAIFGPDMPEVKQLEDSKKSLEKSIGEERDLLVQKARLDCDKAREDFEYLKNAHAQLNQRIVELQQRLIQYKILKREVDVIQQLYDSLLQSSRELTVASGLKAGNITVVEPAEMPGPPKFPRKTRTVMLGGFLGLFLGIGLAFFLEYMDTTIKSSEEVRQMAQIATLAVLPHYGNGRKRAPEAPVELIAHNKPESALSESVRSLRTAVMYSQAAHSPKTILVTSAFPAEGKTTVAINLAITFAQRGQSVLLVDADLKRPGVDRFFELDRKAGLTEILTGKIDGSVIQETEIENLYVMPSGPRAPNPVDLLDSGMMRDLLAHLGEQFDQVIVDSAPLIGMADTEVLAPYVDGVILVVRPGQTPREAVRKLKDKLTSVQGRILGCVFNNPTHARKRPYGYGYGYDYSYSYSYSYGAYGDVEDHSDGNGSGDNLAQDLLTPPRA